MFHFLLFSIFIMAVIFPSGRGSKGKASAEAPSQLDQHLPKSAQALLSSLSDDDREVLSYMLAFGLHMQMLAGLVLPASVKVGPKGDHAFPPLSLQSASGRSQKVSPFFAHKSNCACDCFSCYSSFWSRWAASSNRDILNIIIEMAEMSQEGEDQKASKGKEKKRKQEKKRVQEQEFGCKNVKGGKWKLQSTPQTSATASTQSKIVEATTITELVNDTLGSTLTNVMYDAPVDNISTDALCTMDGSVFFLGVKDNVHSKDVLSCTTGVDVPTIKSTSLRNSSVETASCVRSQQGRSPTSVQHDVDGIPVTQASSPGGLPFASRQGKNNSKFHHTGKRKSNQITPVVFEGTFGFAEEVQDANVLSGKIESTLSPRLADGNPRGKGFLLRIFPDALCSIASCLWEFVSMGARNGSMDYY